MVLVVVALLLLLLLLCHVRMTRMAVPAVVVHQHDEGWLNKNLCVGMVK